MVCLLSGVVTAAPDVPGTDADHEPRVVHIGVRANRGAAKALKRWGPTADYLTQHVPGHRFVLQPFENNSALNQAASRGQFEFVITNPASYVEQEVRYGATRVATLVNKRQGNGYVVFGSVIFTRADRDDIQTLDDLRGLRIMGVDELGFGGWRVAWRELLDEGIDPYENTRPPVFGGGIQQNVVRAVRDGRVDIGVVRTDMLERMAAAGDIDLAAFKVINEKQTPGFPFRHSTRLYPEWPFAKLAHTDDALAEQVARALLAIPATHPAARQGKYVGWHTPLDYGPVKELLQTLGAGPYAHLREITPGRLLERYGYWLAFAALILFAAIAVALHTRRLNARLLATEHHLVDANAQLSDMARLDGLTGIANRRRLDEFLTQEWGQACRRGLHMSMILFDIDHFKEFNDNYGHVAGDECLRSIARQTLALCQRAGDLAVRYGGEEFLVVLSDCDQEQCHRFATRLRQRIESLAIPHRFSPVGPYLTISLGCASLRASPDTPDAGVLINAADNALYRAKTGGRNRVDIAPDVG